MLGKFSRSVVSVSAIVASTLLGFASTASAATNSTEAISAPARGPSVTVTMQQLDMRVAKLPALAGLKAGDQVMITDDSSVTGAAWGGIYTYYPAFSTAPFAAGYARWKDGLVALTPTPPAIAGQPPSGNLDANYLLFNTETNAYYQTISTLIPDWNDPSVMRIPGNAWLFRQNGTQYTTLVDLFVYVSGDQPIWPVAGTLADGVANGTQPVPVASGYWQPQ
jgi:hypothetical protein